MEQVVQIIERLVFDPSVIDLVVWFPHLSWTEFCASTAMVLSWRFLTDRIEGYLIRQARRTLAWGLLHLAVLIRP